MIDHIRIQLRIKSQIVRVQTFVKQASYDGLVGATHEESPFVLTIDLMRLNAAPCARFATPAIIVRLEVCAYVKIVSVMTVTRRSIAG